MHNGQNRYIQVTKNILYTTQFLKTQINNIIGIEVLGEPYMNVVAVRSTESRLNIYSL